MQRSATGFVAFVFLVSSGLAGAAFHLCGMEGLVRSTCCCHEGEDQPPVQLQSPDDCCGALITQRAHPSVTSGADQLNPEAPISSLGGMASVAAFPTRPDESCEPGLARGSPPPHRVPIFIRHCAYLN